MKTTTKHALLALVCTLAMLAGCKKKAIEPEKPAPAETTQMIQRYTYEGKTYNIELTYDKDFNITAVSGDAVAYAQLLKKKEAKPEAYLISQSGAQSNVYDIRVFDDVTAMDKYQGRTAEPAEKSCTNWTSSGGTASYRFYEHDNYSGEFGALNFNNQSYFQREGFSWENDKISSLKIWGTTTGASVDLFEHSCFSGYTRRFYVNTPGQTLNIPSLTLFELTWCDEILRDVYGQVYIYSYPCGNWNDKTSSIKGWSI
jgi:hypothetical protein